MATYYDTSDFEIYRPYFDEDLSIETFVESLNYVSDETNGDKTLEVCEFMKLMMQIKEVNQKLFELLINLMISKENNTYSVYIYLKFLLSSIEDKQKFLTYIDKLEDINQNFEYQCEADKWSHKPLDVVIKMLFEIYDDAYFTDFIDYKDTFGQYRQLNISQYSNIQNCNPDYLNPKFIEIFLSGIRLFLRIRYVVQLIYLISDKNQTKILNEGETSISSIEDFIRRFEKNIDTLTIFYNYCWLKKDTDIDLKQLVAQIPCNQVIKRKFTTEYKVSNMNEILLYIRYRLFADFLLKHCRNFNSDFYRHDSWDEMYPRQIEEFLLAKYDYDSKEDSYNIFRNLHYNKTHSDLLLEKYNGYFKSKLYQSLNNLHILRAKLSDFRLCDRFNITQQEREGLYQYLHVLGATYNYCRFFRYNNLM